MVEHSPGCQSTADEKTTKDVIKLKVLTWSLLNDTPVQSLDDITNTAAHRGDRMQTVALHNTCPKRTAMPKNCKQNIKKYRFFIHRFQSTNKTLNKCTGRFVYSHHYHIWRVRRWRAAESSLCTSEPHDCYILHWCHWLYSRADGKTPSVQK